MMRPFARKKYGFLDCTIERLTGEKLVHPAHSTYKMVDTCAAEFDAERPYFYSAWDDDNEALFTKGGRVSADRKKVLVLGAGPVTIGYGIEQDYCAVHCVETLRKQGCEAVIANNNLMPCQRIFKRLIGFISPRSPQRMFLTSSPQRGHGAQCCNLAEPMPCR